jgi:hypothetical protein
LCSGIDTNPDLLYTLTPFKKRTAKRLRKKKANESLLSTNSLQRSCFMCTTPSTKSNNTHLQRPHSPNPYLELALDTLDVFQLNALPPAPPGRFSPEEEQLLSHANSVVAHFVAANVAAQPSQCKTANDGLVRFACSVTPAIIVVEASVGYKISKRVY